VANKIRNTAKTFHAPSLPNPPAEYSQALTHQRDTTLRIYFQNIDEAITKALQYDTSDIIDGSIPNSKLENSTISFGGVTLSLGGSDATPAFNLSDATGYPTSSLVGTITNAQLAGSITNAKLVNDSVSYGGVSLDLGQTDATPAFDLSDATNYPTSSLSGTITNAQLAGSIANAKLSNSTVSYGGVQLALGASDATPAFDLSDATNYPTSSLSGTIATAQIADDAVTAAKIDEDADITVAGLTVTPSGNAGAVIKATAATNFSAELHLGDTGDTDAGRIQYVNATGSMGIFTENSERVRIDSAGDVGIGTTNPTAKLHIQTGSAVTPASGTDIMVSDSSASAYINLVSNIYGTVGMYLGDTADVDRASVLYSNYYDRMTFNTAASERMRIDSSGRTLIGTTSNGSYSAKLRVGGIIEGSGLRVTSNANLFLNAGNFGSPGIELRSYTSFSSSYAQPIMKFANSTGTEYGSIKILGAATQYNTSSDERLKENIRDADDAGDKIDAIKIRQFDWIEGEHQDYGVIAQELLPVAPEAVSKGYTEDDMMSVDYSKLVPTLIKEIQSLRKRVEELEKDK
tara:strand:+ start:70 stop:1794 length:1725 start_codon:yes stop_codon:yes gene_type:complete